MLESVAFRIDTALEILYESTSIQELHVVLHPFVPYNLLIPPTVKTLHLSLQFDPKYILAVVRRRPDISDLSILAFFDRPGEDFADFPDVLARVTALKTTTAGLANLLEYPDLCPLLKGQLTINCSNAAVTEGETLEDPFPFVLHFENLPGLSISRAGTADFAACIRNFPKSLRRIDLPLPIPTLRDDKTARQELLKVLRESTHLIVVIGLRREITRLSDALGKEVRMWRSASNVKFRWLTPSFGG